MQQNPPTIILLACQQKKNPQQRASLRIQYHTPAITRCFGKSHLKDQKQKKSEKKGLFFCYFFSSLSFFPLFHAPPNNSTPYVLLWYTLYLFVIFDCGIRGILIACCWKLFWVLRSTFVVHSIRAIFPLEKADFFNLTTTRVHQVIKMP